MSQVFNNRGTDLEDIITSGVDAEYDIGPTSPTSSFKIPGVRFSSREQFVETMASKFEDVGMTPEQVHMMARRIQLKIRTDATKPKRDSEKAKQKRKLYK